VLGRRTEAEIDHGGRSDLPGGDVLVERYRGTVGTALDQPGLTWARGSADYRIEWPEATVATSARLDLRGDADAFEVRLDLEAREGDESAGPAPGTAAAPATSPDPTRVGLRPAGRPAPDPPQDRSPCRLDLRRIDRSFRTRP
jgi:hypothetical protein